MIPMSNTSSYERFRQDQAQRRSVARSNSSLLGSLKNFVAAPFARLFTGTTGDFDDPNDLSGKRRLAINNNIENNGSTGYLDPPGSAFHLDNRNNLFNQPPSRSVSISLPSTTLPDSSIHNARSTISPLRNTFSRNMSIDSIPLNQPRPLSRDISMKSLSSIPVEHSLTMRAVSRDSMPPLSSHSFRLRNSATPQPHHSLGRRPNRDVSEPPPVTMLHSNPVFDPSWMLNVSYNLPVDNAVCYLVRPSI
ncbi:hypothetical protein DFH05DRAFT_265496 [Lentinula detonsa]|uniref:Uncharacterized protein n=1 Tax=Lentinula detonsa TaxID=2804962 RepID=A0A9W8TVM5_9AGAR|nr:hypothetical protein DFH05DRAFT_265496 [Lentinula detonsa]